MTVYQNALSLIGNTPLLQLTQLDTGPCTLFLKLESMNPGNSIKDRIALALVEGAEKKGQLEPGGTIVEATAGNTGISLCMVAQQKGYQVILVIPDKMSQEKIDHVKAMGAKVVITRSDVKKGDPDYYHEVAKKIAAQTPGAFYVNQFGNPENPKAHERLTGPEIWSQMEGKIDAFVAGVGTGGTITGVGKFLKAKNPDIDIVLADPEGSILTHYVESGEISKEAGSWLVEGIGEDYIPSICDLSHVNKAYTISDKTSFQTARRLLKKTGIFAGSSTGTLLAAALQYCQAQTSPKRVLTFACDSGAKYLSKLYNETWLKEKGFLDE